MEKQITLLLALILAISLCACGSSKENADTAPAEATTQSATPSGEEDADVIIDKIGVLTMLNMTEEELEKLFEARDIAIKQIKADEQGEEENEDTDWLQSTVKRQIIYYDNLDTMLMALKAGDINAMNVFASTAKYLCSNDDDLVLMSPIKEDGETDTFANTISTGILSNDFSFMMTEDNEGLRDEFNEAIASMKEDGTLDKLVKEQIDGAVSEEEIKPVKMPTIDGAETVKMAVTGSLPPMDYVAADGTPAGFNTAVLAEISKRINKNIELVGLDSAARATALASGQVDAVFWTRSNTNSNKHVEKNEAELKEDVEKRKSLWTDEQLKTLENIDSIIDFNNYGKADMPDGTIITESYFSDSLIFVRTKEGLEAFNQALSK